jgi:CRISPR-associated exonuclease Cas4
MVAAGPVEYKRGRPKAQGCDEVQLCAQALCLEEMLSAEIPAGALFYGEVRRRRDVAFDVALRRWTEEMARRMHELYDARKTPAAVYGKKCDSCSILDRCLPRAERRSAVRYMERVIREAAQES